MRRTAIAAAWIAGATVPLLLGTVFIFGCCVLPFHQVVHKLMPICTLAANILRGADDDAAQPATPAQQKQEPVKRLATEAPGTFRLSFDIAGTTLMKATALTSYRSFITLGAVRCDRDVGLLLFVETFRI